MYKRFGFISLLLVSLLLVSACSQNAGTNTGVNNPPDKTTPGNAGNTAPQTLSMSKLYNFGAVNNYEYQVTNNGVLSDIKYTIKTDTVHGNPAWLQRSDIISQGNNVTVRMWFDKTTYKCLIVTTAFNMNGQNIESGSQCPSAGPNAGDRTGTPELTYVGTESVTVPAGTYNAQKYSLDNNTYYYDSSVPLPLKVSYADGSMMMELVSFS